MFLRDLPKSGSIILPHSRLTHLNIVPHLEKMQKPGMAVRTLPIENYHYMRYRCCSKFLFSGFKTDYKARRMKFMLECIFSKKLGRLESHIMVRMQRIPSKLS